MEVDLPIIGMKQRQKAYSQGKLIRPITKEQICAAYDQGGKDTCQVTQHLIRVVLKLIETYNKG